ncbi:14787_t:CDS:2, partial [Racocetra persica]
MQFEQNMNDIVKVLSREIWNLNLKPNDLILSGILDTEEIRERNPGFLQMLHDTNMLNSFEEIITRLLLPGKLSSFVRNYLCEKEMKISNNEYRSLYISMRTFIDSMDHAMSHISANRNNANSDGPIKKADMFDMLNSSDKEFCIVDKDNKDKSNYKKDDSSSEEIEESCSRKEEWTEDENYDSLDIISGKISSNSDDNDEDSENRDSSE